MRDYFPKLLKTFIFCVQYFPAISVASSVQVEEYKVNHVVPQKKRGQNLYLRTFLQ